MLHVIFVDTLSNLGEKVNVELLWKIYLSIFFLQIYTAQVECECECVELNMNGEFEKSAKLSPKSQAHSKDLRFILTGLA